MSFRRLAAVYNNIPIHLTMGERSVLGYLANVENEQTGLCCPKMATIGEYLGVQRRQIVRIIESLKDKGLIDSVSNGKTNFYSFNFDKISRSDIKDTSENYDVSEMSLLKNDVSEKSLLGETSCDVEMGHKCHTKPGIKPVIENQEVYSTSPTPPAPIGGGGGGVFGKPMVNRAWPTRDEFHEWLNHACVKFGGGIPSDGHLNIQATFDQLNDRNGIDSNGRRVQNWQRYFGKLVRKEIAKWRG